MLYDGRDPREIPTYSVADATRYLGVPSATLRSWVAGRTYPKRDGTGEFEPLIDPAGSNGNRLSFYNLVEAHVLRALRTKHAVPLHHVRAALSYAEKEMGISRLLLSDELHTSAGELFLDRLGALVNLSQSGQLAMRQMLASHLQRVERDRGAIPIRLFPFLGGTMDGDAKPIVIDPQVSFGRPTVSGSGILTAVVVQRIDAGETVPELAADYGLSEADINAAVLFERAA